MSAHSGSASNAPTDGHVGVDHRPSAAVGHVMQAAAAQRESSRLAIEGCGSCWRRGDEPHVVPLSVQLVGDARRRLGEFAAESPLAELRACSAGCALCCHAAVVDVTPAEALAIARFLRERYGDDELAAIRIRLEVNAAKHRQMSSADRAVSPTRCALLRDDNLCSVYESRPLACAGCFSLSRQSCETAHAQATSAGADPAARIPLDTFARAAAVGVSGGMQHAMTDAGLDANLYDLSTAVLRALDTPDAERRWRAGEDIFRGCVCTDRHSPPRLRVDGPSAPRPKMSAARSPQEADQRCARRETALLDASFTASK